MAIAKPEEVVPTDAQAKPDQATDANGKQADGDDDDVDSEVGDSLISFDYAALAEAQRIAADLGEAGAGEADDGKAKKRGGCKESQKKRKRQRREDDVIRAKQAGLPVPSLKELLAAAAAAASSTAASSSSSAAANPTTAATDATEPQTSTLPVVAKAAESDSIAVAAPAIEASSATSPEAEAAAKRLAKEAARRKKVADALNARTVFVTNLPFKVTEKDISEWMVNCGTVKSIRMSKDKGTGKPLGYAHVQFESSESVATAIEKCDRFDVQGRVVRVARVGKGEKCQFDLPQEIKDDILALIREAYEGKNISTIKDAWQKRHPGQKLDTSKYGFKNFSAAMHTIEGLSLEHHVEKKLTFQAYFTGSAAHTAFLAAQTVAKAEAEVKAAAEAKAKAEAAAAAPATEAAAVDGAAASQSAAGVPAAAAAGAAAGEPADDQTVGARDKKRPHEESKEGEEAQAEEQAAKKRCVNEPAAS